jgi:hypothetical protein
MVEAAEADDVVKFVDFYEEAEKFEEGLRKGDYDAYKKQQKELDKWWRDNEYALEMITEFYDMHYREIKKEMEKRGEYEYNEE